MELPYPIRSLSKQEAQAVTWLEAERRATVTPDDVAEALGWERPTIRKVLARLAEKGWLIRVAQGRYQTVLAETGGFALPNPWAALSLWQQRYYVGFQSAAYEHALTPDRPGDVQVCVPYGARRPRAWAEFPIALIWQRGFSAIGATERDLHCFRVWIASPAKLLVDAVSPSEIHLAPGGALTIENTTDEALHVKIEKLGYAMTGTGLAGVYTNLNASTATGGANSGYKMSAAANGEAAS